MSTWFRSEDTGKLELTITEKSENHHIFSKRNEQFVSDNKMLHFTKTI